MKEKFKLIYCLFFRKHLRALLFCLIVSVIMSALSFIEPTLNKYLIDVVIGKREFSNLYFMLLIYGLIFLFENLFSFLVQHKGIKISLASVAELKEAIIEKIQKKKLTNTEEYKDDTLVTITQDVSVISSFYNDVLLSTIVSVIYAVLLVLYLARSTMILTIIVILSSFTQLYIIKCFAGKIKENITEFKENSSDEFGYINSTLENMKLIKAYTYQRQNINKYANILSFFKKITWKNFKITYSQSLAISTISVLSNALVISMGTYLVFANKLSLGTFVVFISLSNNLKASFDSILSITVSLQRFKVSLDRVYEIIKEINVETGEKIDSEIQSIAFENLKYSVRGNQLYEEFNLLLNPGVPYVIVGDNATGKSTLIDMLLKEVKINEGTICINDRNIDEINDEFVCSKVAVSFQKNFFLKDTILENITMGCKDFKETELDDILSIADCKSIIESLDQGLDTVLSDSNNKLSGGEMQKLNLARALAKKADIYIFDEVFSNIDENSRDIIFDNIVQYLREKIIVFITHDESIMNKGRDNLWKLKDKVLVNISTNDSCVNT